MKWKFYFIIKLHFTLFYFNLFNFILSGSRLGYKSYMHSSYFLLTLQNWLIRVTHQHLRIVIFMVNIDLIFIYTVFLRTLRPHVIKQLVLAHIWGYFVVLILVPLSSIIGWEFEEIHHTLRESKLFKIKNDILKIKMNFPF